MKKLTLRHELNCSVDNFWRVFFDKDFNTSLFTKELRFPAYSILDQTEKPTGEITRRVSGQPKMNAPAAVQKLLGDSFRYDEEGRLDPVTRIWRFTMKPSTLADKLRTEGTVRCEPLGEGKCRRIAEIEIEVKIFGLGGMMESFTENEMKAGWDASAAFMNRWLKEHPPA
ncbi:MAG: DUF2505 domain-containing protein [Myxococcales bacterium]|nr:DUF2505 domain-containing protein [Myxococcales bacterium]